MTTYQSAFSRNQNNDMLTKTLLERELRERGAGSKREDERRIGGIKMSSVLSAEQYRDYDDPQHNTHCQRTWVYGGEKALSYTDNGLRKTLNAMGGTATPEALVGMYRYARNPKAKVGDGATTLPLESRHKI